MASEARRTGQPAGNLDDPAEFTVSVKAGDFVYREQDQGSDMFIIREGRVNLTRQYAGQARVVEMLEAGDFFGEMSLLEGQARELSAQAVVDCQLFRIDGSTFDLLVQEAPEIPIRMLRKLGRRLREHQEHDARAAAIAMGPLDHEPGTPAAEGGAGGGAAAVRPAAAIQTYVLSDAAGSTRFELTGRTQWIVGRSDRASGFAPDIDLSKLDTQRTIGRRHATIVRDADAFVLGDTASRNGTFVNDTRLQPGVPHTLTHGDRVRFGLVETVFEAIDQPAVLDGPPGKP